MKITMCLAAALLGVGAAAYSPDTNAYMSMTFYVMPTYITTCTTCDKTKVGLSCPAPALNCETGGGAGFTIDGRHYDAKYYPGVTQ